jgi:hypothetical protein
MGVKIDRTWTLAKRIPGKDDATMVLSFALDKEKFILGWVPFDSGYVGMEHENCT